MKLNLLAIRGARSNLVETFLRSENLHPTLVVLFKVVQVTLSSGGQRVSKTQSPSCIMLNFTSSSYSAMDGHLNIN